MLKDNLILIKTRLREDIYINNDEELKLILKE